MLPREGTETKQWLTLEKGIMGLITHVTSRGDGNLNQFRYKATTKLLITHVTSRGDGNSELAVTTPRGLVNNPCYLERGRKQLTPFWYGMMFLVNNPCYLERGRKPSTILSRHSKTVMLITHVTSRGDGNLQQVIVQIALIKLITHVTSRGDGNKLTTKEKAHHFRLITHVTSRGDGNTLFSRLNGVLSLS